MSAADNGAANRAADNLFPSSDVLRRLAISDTGFVFDPVTGQSFSVGETGTAVLKAARELQRIDAIVEFLLREYAATPLQIERDLQDFGQRLKELLK